MNSKVWVHHIVSREESNDKMYVDVCWMTKCGRLFITRERERFMYEYVPVMMRFFFYEQGVEDPYVSLYSKIDKIYAMDRITGTAWVKFKNSWPSMRVDMNFLFCIRPELRKQFPYC